MSSAPSDLQPQKVFTARRRRAILSFRRKGDVVWFVTSLGLFVAGFTALAYTLLQLRRPLVIARAPDPAVTPLAPDAAPHPVAPAALTLPVPPAVEEPVEVPASAVDVEAEPPVQAEIPAPSPVKKSRAERREAARTETPPAPRTRAYSLLDDKATTQVLFDKNARVAATPITAVGESALRLDYDFQRGEWVQAFLNIKQDLGKYTRVQFAFNGEGGNNTLEFKIVDADGSNFGATWTHRTGRSAWTVVDVPLAELAYLWGGDNRMDWSRVRQIYFAVSRKSGDEGGKGRVVIRGVTFS